MSLFKPKMDPAIKAKAERPGVLVFVSVPCVSGLPVPEKTMAQVYYFEDHLEIDAGGTEYNLTLEKVQEIAIQTHVERQTQAVSSVGSAMLGAAIAGPIGAAIGGRAKEKKIQSTTSFLVVSYTGKDGAPAYIAFDALYTPKCADIVKLFQKRPRQTGKIEL